MIDILPINIRLPLLDYKWNKYNKNLYKIEYISKVTNRRINILIDYFISKLREKYKKVYYLDSSIIYYISNKESKIEPIYLNMDILDIFIILPNKFKSIYIIIKGEKIYIDNSVLGKRNYIIKDNIESLIYKDESLESSIIIKLEYMVTDIDDIDDKYIKLYIIKNKLQNYYKYYLTNNRMLNNRLYINLINLIIKHIEEIEDIEDIEDIDEKDSNDMQSDHKDDKEYKINKSDIKLLGTIGIMMGIKSFLLLYDIIMDRYKK